jgi:hypothetical protein
MSKCAQIIAVDADSVTVRIPRERLLVKKGLIHLTFPSSELCGVDQSRKIPLANCGLRQRCYYIAVNFVLSGNSQCTLGDLADKVGGDPGMLLRTRGMGIKSAAELAALLCSYGMLSTDELRDVMSKNGTFKKHFEQASVSKR